LVLNLEGPIVGGDPAEAAVLDEWKFNLYSHPSFAEVAESLGVAACGLANNHVTDYRGELDGTRHALISSGIDYFGTNDRPYCEFACAGRRYVVLGVCSPLPEPVFGKQGARPNRFAPRSLLRQIGDMRRENPDAQLVVFVHWGYELAQYPEPADREWAHHAIEAGADYVIGHHPHVVQGVERHRDGLIAYSLGNFLLPQVRFRDRVLRYLNDDVLRQLGLCISDGNVRLYWMRYDICAARVSLEHVSDILENDELNKHNTPFSGMSNARYHQWFRETGRHGALAPRRGGPVFWSYAGAAAFDSALKLGYLKVKRFVRKVAIRCGFHRPYNW
jgi:poly-gamma-glutamate synthesis protein (capsule biosynthesis protein)